MRSEAYWKRRAAKRMEELQRDAEGRMSGLTEPYRAAQARLLREIRKVLDAYRRRYGVDEETAKAFLSAPADRETLRRLKEAVERMPEGRAKRTAEAELNAPGTRYRISNLQAMREQIKVMTEELSGEEQELFTDSLTRSIREAYLRETYEQQSRAGLVWEPEGISSRFVRQTLRENWSGKNYKTRINGHMAELAERVQHGVMETFLYGRSRGQLAEDLAKEFHTTYLEAKRLLVTETTYVTNAANEEAYRETGIEEYRYTATLDLRTSETCQELDGKVFPVKRAKAGKNFPPMHPNCRSTTVAVVSREWLETVERKAVDPVTGEYTRLPAGTTYRQWLGMLEEKYGKEKIDQLREQAKERVSDGNRETQERIDGKTAYREAVRAAERRKERAQEKRVDMRAKDTKEAIEKAEERQNAKEMSTYVPASTRFLNRMEQLYRNALKIVPIDGYEDIVIHGDKYGFVYKDAEENDRDYVSADEFADILLRSPEYHGGPIRLIACESAADGAITAQHIANRTGQRVMAPSDLVWVNEEGDITIGPEPLINTGEWRIIEPRRDKK